MTLVKPRSASARAHWVVANEGGSYEPKLVAAVAAIVLFASGGVLAQGKGSSKPAPLQPLAFYDWAGQLVGRVAIPGYEISGERATILLPWGGDFVSVFVDGSFQPDGYTRQAWFVGYGQVFFSDLGCTGTGYVSSHNIPEAFTGLPRRLSAVIECVLYVSMADVPPTYPNVQSVRHNGVTCSDGVSSAGPLVPLDATLDLAAQFSRPLVLK